MDLKQRLRASRLRLFHKVVGMELVPVGTHGGHRRRLLLDCGHTKDTLYRTRVGALTGCPVCR